MASRLMSQRKYTKRGINANSPLPLVSTAHLTIIMYYSYNVYVSSTMFTCYFGHNSLMNVLDLSVSCFEYRVRSN